MIATAEEEVKRLQEDANNEIVALEKQLDELKKARNSIQEELKSYLASCLEALERDEVPVSFVSPPSLGEEEFQEGDGYPSAPGETEDDLEDLYEKIELPAEMDLAGIGGDQPGAIEEGEERAEENPSEEPEEEMGPLLPDINGDMMFTMNDPVDIEEEPAVVIEDLDEEDEPKSWK